MRHRARTVDDIDGELRKLIAVRRMADIHCGVPCIDVIDELLDERSRLTATAASE